MIVSHEQFEKARLKANKFYEKNKVIVCPALGNIRLTPEGMEHIRKKDRNHHREQQETYVRYKCFLNIKDVLNKMHYYQEYKIEIKEVPERKNGRNIFVKKMVTYIAFIAIVKVGMEQKRIKIVVSNTQGRDYYEFISIIPSRNSKGYNYFENEEGE